MGEVVSKVWGSNANAVVSGIDTGPQFYQQQQQQQQQEQEQTSASPPSTLKPSSPSLRDNKAPVRPQSPKIKITHEKDDRIASLGDPFPEVKFEETVQVKPEKKFTSKVEFGIIPSPIPPPAQFEQKEELISDIKGEFNEIPLDESENKDEEAAVKIQANARRYLTRKHLEEIAIPPPSSFTNESGTRAANERKIDEYILLEKEEDSDKEFKTDEDGFIRDESRTEQGPIPSIELPSPNEEDAAVKIQAAFRGYQVRKSLSRDTSPYLREQKNEEDESILPVPIKFVDPRFTPPEMKQPTNTPRKGSEMEGIQNKSLEIQEEQLVRELIKIENPITKEIGPDDDITEIINEKIENQVTSDPNVEFKNNVREISANCERIEEDLNRKQENVDILDTIKETNEGVPLQKPIQEVKSWAKVAAEPAFKKLEPVETKLEKVQSEIANKLEEVTQKCADNLKSEVMEKGENLIEKLESGFKDLTKAVQELGIVVESNNKKSNEDLIKLDVEENNTNLEASAPAIMKESYPIDIKPLISSDEINDIPSSAESPGLMGSPININRERSKSPNPFGSRKRKRGKKYKNLYCT